MHLFINDVEIHLHTHTKFIDHKNYSVIIDASQVMLNYDRLYQDVLIYRPSVREIKETIQLAIAGKLEGLSSLTFLISELIEIKKIIKNEFKIIEAAGGLVTKNDKVLMIYRLKKWDLPKGKMESGENFRETAIREVEEECNIKLMLESKLCTTWHFYFMGKTKVLKKTKWYLMRCLDDKKMKPQVSEDIEQLSWMNQNETAIALQNSYKSIAFVVDVYYRWFNLLNSAHTGQNIADASLHQKNKQNLTS